jgi:putative transposase
VKCLHPRSARQLEDERLLGVIRDLHERKYCAYGSRRMRKALLRAGERVGRGRAERLMRANGLQGAKRRGKPWRTTRPDPSARRSPDLVQRDFTASGENRPPTGTAITYHPGPRPRSAPFTQQPRREQAKRKR